MRTAAIATAAALVALVLAGCDPVAGPPPKTENSFGAAPEPRDAEALLSPAPPLWRIDPAMDLSRHILDGVPDDPQHGVPAPLRGLRINVLQDQKLRSHPDLPSPPALSRDDFRKWSSECVNSIAGWGAMNNLRMGHYRSAEKQTFWYASLRAKEAVYGDGAEEAGCERMLLEQALDVARGQWRNVFRSPERETILADLVVGDKGLREDGFPSYDDQWGWEDPEAVARLEWWLGAYR